MAVANGLELPTPEAGDNLPAFGLPMLDTIAPDRVAFQPKIADALELHHDAIRVLKDLDGFTLKGDTTVYAQVMEHIAELAYRSIEGLGVKEGVDKGDDPVRGISLSTLTPTGPVPKTEAWLELKALFMKEVEDATTESGIEFKNVVESPTLINTLPKCYKAGILMAQGVVENRIFKKTPRPVLGTPAEPLDTHYDARRHVKAPSAPFNMLKPMVVFEDTSKKKAKSITKPNSEKYFTYMSADNAALLHDKIFSKNTLDSPVETNERTGKLSRKKAARDKSETKTAAKKVEVHLGEGSTPADVWAGMQAMTREMKTGEVIMPSEIQKQAISTVQEMVENLDKKGIEFLSGDLVNLADAISVQCEASGIIQNVFIQAAERLDDIPNIFKLSDDERVPLMELYKELHEQISKAA